MPDIDYEWPASVNYRRSKVQGQLSFELEDPTGFLEAPYKPERGALFLSDSWSSHGRIPHLIRDTPDGLTHLGWSRTAEYRRAGRWIPISDALDDDAECFSRYPSKKDYLRDRWCLAGHTPGAGSAVATELCGAAISWWDSHGDATEQPEGGPDMVDFCAVFPTLTARRKPGESEWHLRYTTDTAAWTRVPGGTWLFAGRISARDKVDAITRQSGLERPWRQYGQTRRKNLGNSAVDFKSALREQESLAEALGMGTELPLLLPLLKNLLREAPTGRWSFDLLAKYNAINATTGVDLLEGQDVGQLHVQNDLCRWIARGERWVQVKRERRRKSTVPIEIPQLTEAALSLAANPRAASQYWADELQSTKTWVITDTEAERVGDFPIYDIVRGTSRNSSAGWKYFADHSGWVWQKVEELRYDHHLPRWEGDDRLHADRTVIAVSENLGLLLLDYERADSPRAREEDWPMWSDFLHWVKAES
jgi:hypothetical protein